MAVENRFVYSDELAAVARETGLPYNEIWPKIEAEVRADHPIYLGIVDAVVYVAEKDRYVAKFGKSSARIANDAATFLLTHAFNHAKPTVYARMTDGIIDGVLLMFLSRT